MNGSSTTSTSLTNAVTGNNSNGNEKVRLQLYAQGLPNVSGGHLSRRSADPFAVVTILANDPNEKPIILGKTEVIKNSYNPRWVTSFDLNYDFTRNTRINIGIYDEVKSTNEVIMGSAMFEVGEVLGSKGNIKAKRLRKGGSIFVRITPAPVVQDHILTLCFHGINIKNVEGLFGKTDPFFELTSQIISSSGTNKSWQPVYRSKHIDNNLNPKWESFNINTNTLCDSDFFKPIQFVLWDYDKKGKHTFMGSFETSINGLISQVDNTNNSFTVKKNGKDFGKIKVVTAQIIDANSTSIVNNNNSASMATTAPVPVPLSPPQQMNSSISNVIPMPPPATTTSSNIPPSNTSNNLPPFSEALLHPIPPPQQPQQSTQPSSSTTPSFQNAVNTVSTTSYYANSFNNNNNNNSSTPRPAQQQSLPSQVYQPTSSYQNTPIIPLPPPVAPPKRPKFIEYLAGGCELELSIAIDYTGSNGDPRVPGTLHYIHPDGTLNDYEKAITAVGSVIARYDTDQKFPVFGFGAKYNGLIQHCFQVGNASELNGLSNVLQAYRQVFHTGLTMSGPTVFSEVIDYAAAAARSKQEHSQRIGQQSYRILLILSDGAVTDPEQTKRSIMNASDAPLSIVIVGIGNADFSAMNFLDNFRTMDNGSGNNNTSASSRDICQFVEFTKYKNDKSGLTTATLEEIPDQIVDYYYNKGIMPLPEISGSQFSLTGLTLDDADDDDIDLNININPDGEISLANYQGTQYNDSQYDTYNTYNIPPPVVPPAQTNTMYQQQSSSSPQPPPAPYRPTYQQQSLTPPHSPQRPTAPTSNSYTNLPGQQQQQPSSTYNPYNQQPSNTGAAPYNPYGQQQSSSTQSSYNQGFQQMPQQVYQQPPPQQPQPERVFHVQTPPNVKPGSQLKITNPFTQQEMIVTIPQGVQPGGKFAVKY